METEFLPLPIPALTGPLPPATNIGGVFYTAAQVRAYADDCVTAKSEQHAAALALLKRIRYHAERHTLPREWLTAADEVLGTWGPVRTTHPEIAA